MTGLLCSRFTDVLRAQLFLRTPDFKLQTQHAVGGQGARVVTTEISSMVFDFARCVEYVCPLLFAATFLLVVC